MSQPRPSVGPHANGNGRHHEHADQGISVRVDVDTQVPPSGLSFPTHSSTGAAGQACPPSTVMTMAAFLSLLDDAMVNQGNNICRVAPPCSNSRGHRPPIPSGPADCHKKQTPLP